MPTSGIFFYYAIFAYVDHCAYPSSSFLSPDIFRGIISSVLKRFSAYSLSFGRCAQRHTVQRNLCYAPLESLSAKKKHSRMIILFIIIISLSNHKVNVFVSKSIGAISKKAPKNSAVISNSYNTAYNIPIYSFFSSLMRAKYKKERRPQSTLRKPQTPIVATQNQINRITVSDILSDGTCVFTKFKNSMSKKGYNIPHISRETINP